MESSENWRVVWEEENALFPTTSFTLITRISQQSVFIYNNKTKDFTTSVKCSLSLFFSRSQKLPLKVGGGVVAFFRGRIVLEQVSLAQVSNRGAQAVILHLQEEVLLLIFLARHRRPRRGRALVHGTANATTQLRVAHALQPILRVQLVLRLFGDVRHHGDLPFLFAFGDDNFGDVSGAPFSLFLVRRIWDRVHPFHGDFQQLHLAFGVLDARAKARQARHIGGAFDFHAFFTAFFEHFGDIFFLEPSRGSRVFLREILCCLYQVGRCVTRWFRDEREMKVSAPRAIQQIYIRFLER